MTVSTKLSPFLQVDDDEEVAVRGAARVVAPSADGSLAWASGTSG